MIPDLPASQVFEVIRWFFWLWVAGIAVTPLANRLFQDQSDGGYIAAKILGWLGFAYFPWLAASLGLVSLKASGPVIGICALFLTFIACRSSMRTIPWKMVLKVEIGFLVLFLLGLAARLQMPDLSGLEKFMDLGFMAAAMRADVMPPQDMWMAGEPINYYYYGHAGAALWALLTDISVDHGYQLHMASLFALTGLGIYRLCRELTKTVGYTLSLISGYTGTLLVLYAGNFHSVLYTVFRSFMGSEKASFYYPDSTRFIGFDPATEDKAFTEFVAYGFHVGDMHAHVLATPGAVLAVLALLSALRNNWHVQFNIFYFAILIGWLLGLSYMTNAWDLAVIGLISLYTGLAVFIRSRQRIPVRFDRLFSAGLVCLAVCMVTMAPFLNSFEVFVSGISSTRFQTPFWQLAVIYGHGAVAIFAFLVLFPRRAAWSKPEHVFTFIICITVVTLIIIPELVYVNDGHGEDYARANTMFKLSFRSQMLLQIAALSAIIYFAAGTRRDFLFACLLSLPLISTFSYAQYTFQPPGKIVDLDGLDFLGEERNLVEYVGSLPLPEGSAILEAGGNSFTSASRVSSVTGLPTVLGWLGHETLWRGYNRDISMRHEAVNLAYTTQNLDDLCRVIKTYKVKYLIVGQIEQSLYPETDLSVLGRIGDIVYMDKGGRVIAPREENCS